MSIFDTIEDEEDKKVGFESPEIENGALDREPIMDNGEYTPPAQLDIPEEVNKNFTEKGYVTRWVNRDPKNIRKRMSPQEGYTFVKPTELTFEELIAVGDVEGDGNASMITNGDLVLMKVTIERNEARKKYYRDKTHAQASAIDQRLAAQDIDSAGSRSVVRTGKNAHFRT
jgi:hypothetical protein